MKYLKVWQKDIVDGKSRFDVRETEETFHSVYFNAYANAAKTIKVYFMSDNIFEVYFKDDNTLSKAVSFLKQIGYNDHDDPIDTTPVSTNYIKINLSLKIAILSGSERPIKDYKINWEDPVNHIYAYRSVENFLANEITVYFRNYKTAKRWLDALKFIGFSVTDCRKG